jgi:glutamate/tyrosine decarboxylase-like PLP-dependent enzyme
LHQICASPNAAYLPAGDQEFPNPLHRGIENSRRFRALPVYAALLSEGRYGFAEIFKRMVHLARGIAGLIRDSEAYEWLPNAHATVLDIHMIVLFRAKDPGLNDVLVQRINETGKIFVSGTTWRGEKATRIAVSNWQADLERDLPVVQQVLLDVAAAAKSHDC